MGDCGELDGDAYERIETIAITAMKPALHDLFMYLSDEVFNNMELEQKEWLLSFSIFPVFSERLSTGILWCRGGSSIARTCRTTCLYPTIGGRRNIPLPCHISTISSNRNGIAEDLDRFSSLHKKAANYLQAENNAVQAIYHAVKSGDDVFIAQILADTGAH